MIVAFFLSLSYCLHIDICFFHRITGWNCPGCGATHMLLALLRGELRRAFWYNPVLLILLPALCVVIGDIYIRFLKTGFIVPRPWERGLLIMVGVLLIAFGVVRNCILRRAAATDAESSGHPADLNGHPQNLIPCA